MNTLKNIIDVLGALFEIYVINMLYFCLFEKKVNFKVLHRVIYPLSIFLLFIFNIVPQLRSFGPVLALIAVFLVGLCFKITYKIPIACLTFSLFLVSEIITGMLLVLITQKTVEEIQNNLFSYLSAVIFSKFLVYIISTFIKTKYKYKDYVQKPKYMIATLLMPISSALIIFLLFLLAYNVKDTMIIWLVVISSIVLILANIGTLYTMEKLLESEENKTKLFFIQNQLEMQASHYKELEQTQIDINRVYHDMKNHLIAISGYIKTNDYNKVNMEISKLSNGILSQEQRIDTGNVCLDALLAAKIERMKQYQIKFDQKVELPPILKIDYIDFCIIVGNALDNAIEASEKIVDTTLRSISLCCSSVDDYLIIKIMNMICKEDRDSKLITTKRDSHLHGIGLHTISSIAEKNKGNILIEKDGDIFIMKIILCNI